MLNGAGLFLNAPHAGATGELCQRQRRELWLRRALARTAPAAGRVIQCVELVFSGQPVKVLLLYLLVGQQAFLRQ